MPNRFRSHLSFANVVSMLALFFALGVGAYAANTVGSSDVIDDSLLSVDVKGKLGNSTTAAENGSLTGADISGQVANPAVGQPFVEGSLTGADVKDNSLTGADVNESTLASVPNAANGAKKIDFDHANTDTAFTAVLTLGELSLQAKCFAKDPGSAYVQVDALSSTDADLDYSYEVGDNDATPSPTAKGASILAGGGATVLTLAANKPDFERAEGQLVYRNATRVISVAFHAKADTVTQRCQVRGTAVQASS
jgi:hypothetical protein